MEAVHAKPKPAPLSFTPARCDVLRIKSASGGLAGDYEPSKTEGLLARRSTGNSEFDPVHSNRVPHFVQDVVRSPGRPLDVETRAFFEPRFGHDFGKVRVHIGANASASADALNAHAFAAGQHIVFASGQYAPETPRGRHVLAHELAHTLQPDTRERFGIHRIPKDPQGPPFEGEIIPWSAALHEFAIPSAKVLADLPRGQRVTVQGGHAWILVETTVDGKMLTGYVSHELIRQVSAPKAPAQSTEKAAEETAKAVAGSTEAGAKTADHSGSHTDRKICGPDVTAWLMARMVANSKSSLVTEMKKNNTEDWKGVDLGSLSTWYQLVKTGGPWDYKKDLGAAISLAPCRQNCSGKLYSITLDGQCMTYEVVANIHYAYVGRAAGFTESRLLGGAADAQVSEDRGETADDPRDVQAIKKGFALFDAGSPSGLTKSGLEANYYQNVPAGDGDPAGCEPCSTKLT